MEYIRKDASRIALIWIAPSGRTASRAPERPIPGHQNCPQPLRSDNQPDAIDELSGIDKYKVEMANLLYDAVLQITECAAQLDICVAIENPANSHYWNTTPTKTLLEKFGGRRVTFHACAHGGSPDKLTTIWQSKCYFDSLELRCDKKHSHGEEFCDGFGLCSSGRWHPNNRSKKRLPEQLDFCRGLRKMIDEFCERVIPDLGRGIMKLVLGRCQQSPFSSTDLQSLQESWFRSLPDPHSAAQVTEGQPFFLHALAQSLRPMGDPDVDVVDTTTGSNFIEGVHVGHTSPLGPTPQVFRPRVKQAV